MGDGSIAAHRGHTARSRARRLGADDYLNEAIAVLGEHGVGGLTTTRLCERLGVTRGSLYHHFASGPALHDAVIEHWETVLVPLGVAAIEAVEPSARIELLHQLALHVDPRSESAIRAWANTNPTVAAAVRRVDVAREAMLARSLAAVGIDESTAETLARIGCSLLVGAIQLDDALDHDRLEAVLAEFRVWVDHYRTDHHDPSVGGS